MILTFLHAVRSAFWDAAREWRRMETRDKECADVFKGVKQLKLGDECPQCGGAGQIWILRRSNPGPIGWVDCSVCKGKGVMLNL